MPCNALAQRGMLLHGLLFVPRTTCMRLVALSSVVRLCTLLGFGILHCSLAIDLSVVGFGAQGLFVGSSAELGR